MDAWNDNTNILFVTKPVSESNLSKPGYLGYTNIKSSSPARVWVKALYIENIELTITVPKAGQKMSLDIVKTQTANTEAFLDQWSNVTDSKIMTGTDVFEDGKSYGVTGMIYPKNGYVFTFNPTVSINGVKLSELNYADSEAIEFFYTAAAADTTTAFKDVAADAWYRDAVSYVFSNKLMVGTSNTTFEPDTSLTRAMIVTILYRRAGEPDVSALENPFNDIPAGQWFTNAVIWAAADGVVNGYGNGKFGPDDAVTEEQLAAIIHRTQTANNKIPADQGKNKTFGDADKIADWAKDAVAALNRQGVFGDIPGNNFNPQKSANRAEVASVLYRWLTAK